jgi:hypothetical protein
MAVELTTAHSEQTKQWAREYVHTHKHLSPSHAKACSYQEAGSSDKPVWVIEVYEQREGG